MRILRYFWLFLLLAACTFEPEDDFYVKVEKPDPSPTQFLFFEEGDTLNLRKTVEFDLRSSTGSDVVHHKLMLGNVVISENDAAPYFESVNSRDYPDGTYDLTLILIKKAHGGSLASALELEFYEERITKKVIIFNGPIPKPKVIAITVEDGVLNIKWEKYEGQQFKKLYLRANFEDQIEITDKGTVKHAFPNYVGGSAHFQLSLVAYNDEVATFDTVYHHDIHQHIEKTAIGIKFSWDSSPFKNWDGVRINVLNSSNVWESFFVDKSKNEFSIDKDWIFPYYTQTSISVVSTDHAELPLEYKNISSQVFESQPPSYPTISNYIVGSLEDTAATIYYSGATIGTDMLIRKRMKEWDDEITRRTGIISVSPTANHIFEFNNNVVSKIDEVTLEATEQFSVGAILGTYDQFLQLHISTNQLVLLYVLKGTEKWYYTIDWVTKSVIMSSVTRPENPLTKSGKLSHDGRNFFSLSQYRFIGLYTTPNKIRAFFQEDVFKTFPIADNMRMIYYNGGDNLIFNQYSESGTTGVVLPYAKNVKAVFSNQLNHFGVAYTDNGRLTFDFINTESLEVTQTVKTNLYSNINYKYHFFGNKLVVWEPSGFLVPHVMQLNF